MAKSKPASDPDQPEQEPVLDAEPEPKAAPAPDPLKEDGQGDPMVPAWVQPTYGPVVPALTFKEREPLIHIGGQEYRHVADHTDGAWIYRSDK